MVAKFSLTNVFTWSAISGVVVADGVAVTARAGVTTTKLKARLVSKRLRFFILFR